MSIKSSRVGIGTVLTKAEVQIQVEIVCAECYQPLTIASILHFADCPQIKVNPCLCQTKTAVDLILAEIKNDVSQVDRLDKQQSEVPTLHPKDFPPPQNDLP